MEFYAYWNGEQIRALFEALVSITGNLSFMGLLQCVALIGLLSAFTVGALQNKLHEPMTFIMAVVLMYGMILVPKTTLTIRDDRAASVYNVDNVPLGIAFVASASSSIGHFLTQSFENVFTNVDAERFSRFGMVFPQRALNAVLAAGPVTPTGRVLISNFNRQCVLPELVDTPAKVQALTESGNVWATIATPGWVNPARRTPNVDGSWITCDAAIEAIENHMNATEIPAIESMLAMKLMPDRVNASLLVAGAVSASESILLDLSGTFADTVKHSVFINTLDEDLTTAAALSDNPLAVATKLAKAQGNLTSEINYRTMSQIAQDALPKIRNALQFVILSAFPLVFVMVIGMGIKSPMIIRNYVTLIVWMELWAPICAVINFLIISVDAHPMSQIIAQYGANTVMAATLIREMGASSQAIAGYLMILAPVIAFAIAKGSDIASAQMAGAIMAPAQSAAQSQGATLSQGNVSLGNVSAGNVSANTATGNKMDTSIAHTQSAMMQTHTAYGSVTRSGEGNVTGMRATEISTGITSSWGLGQRESAQYASQESVSMGYSDAVSQLSRFSTTSSDASTASFARQLEESVAKRHGLLETGARQDSIGSTRSSAMSSEFGHSLENHEHMGFQTTVGAKTTNTNLGATLPLSNNTSNAIRSSLTEGNADKINAEMTDPKSNLNLGIGGGAGVNVVTAQKLSDTVTNTSGTATREEKQQAYQELLAATRDIAATTSDAGVRAAAERYETQLTRAMEQTSNTSFNRSASFAASESAGLVSNQDIRTLMNTHPEAVQKAIDTFGSPERAQEALFHSAATRRAFAASFQDDLKRATPAFEEGAPVKMDTVNHLSQKHHSSFTQESLQAVNTAHATNLDNVEVKQKEQVGDGLGRTPDSGTVRNISDNFRNHFKAESSALEYSLDQTRGAQNASHALYEMKQHGAGTVMDNALLGGAFYQSPTQYDGQLRAMDAENAFLAPLGKEHQTISIDTLEKSLQLRELELGKHTPPDRFATEKEHE